MYKSRKSIHTLSAGAAIFSMFFGAGNAVFPIQLGVGVGENLIYSLVGLLLTGIGGPMLGLVASLSFKGDSLRFYSRWGQEIGYFFLVLSLALLGPFCVLPRCYIVAFSAVESLLPNLNPLLFSMIFSICSLCCTIRKNKLLNILGYMLSPILIFCLVLIIFNSIGTGYIVGSSSVSPSTAMSFYRGISAGYDTMDLIAAIIFSGSIWNLLSLTHKDQNVIHAIAWRASLVGGLLLGLIYCGLAIAASMHSELLNTVPAEYLLTTLASECLGSYLSVVASLAIALACFTTVVSLTYAISRIASTEIAKGKFSERNLILWITVLSTCFSLVEFATIQNILHSVLNFAYPVIIILTILNFYGRKYSLDSEVGSQKKLKVA